VIVDRLAYIHGRSLPGALPGGVAKPLMTILLWARGAKPLMRGNVSIFEYPGFASSHSAGRVYILSSFV